jgi:serine/threonine-protein kinase RsbW
MAEALPRESPQEISMEFHLPAELAGLCAIRQRIVELARQYRIDETDIAQIEISVDEACANVVKHAYGPDRPPEPNRAGALIVIVQILADRIVIEVKDKGIGESNGPHQGVSDLIEYVNLASHAGLGLYIIDKCMDDYHFSFPDPAGTQLSMTKYIRRTA